MAAAAVPGKSEFLGARSQGPAPLAKTSRPAVDMESVPAADRSIPSDRWCLLKQAA